MRRALIVALILLAASFGPAALLSHGHAGGGDPHHGLGLDHGPQDHDHGTGDAPVVDGGVDVVPGREARGVAPASLAVLTVADGFQAREEVVGRDERPWRPPVAPSPQVRPASLRAPPR